jgi:F0F1-type ATP synthase membrane subunit c/vacuolar-type H+-ATPase subunit K
MSDYDPNRDPRYHRDPRYDHPEPEDVRFRQEIIFSRIANAVWLITFIILAIIMLRVVLLLINANEQNAFVNWVYNTSEFFVRPFLGITNDPSFNGAVFEINSLIAMLIYVLIIYGILQLVRVVLDMTAPTEP